MVTNIRQNAENAGQTEQIALDTAEQARKSEKAVEDTVLAMQEITKKIRIRETLSQLLPAIQQTTELVQEISAASKEQHGGAEQINQAIQQLDQIIQHNTLTSAELSTEADHLSAQAEQLHQAMAFF